MSKQRISRTIMPHTTPELFRAVFEAAKRKWPGKALSLIGTREDGTIVMQEFGNPEPFELTMGEVKA